jgi:drug/metabolite transporter (DMT)-like permease
MPISKIQIRRSYSDPEGSENCAYRKKVFLNLCLSIATSYTASMRNTNVLISQSENAGKGMAFGLLGVMGFAITLPATRVLVQYVDPVFAGMSRICGAGALAAILLAYFRQPLPNRRQFSQLAVVALGVVVGFPILSSLAMSGMKAIHGGVVVGILPLVTAALGALIFGERPSAVFWIMGAIGSAIVLTFVAIGGGATFSFADIFLMGAILSAGLGYSVGGNLAKSLGGWQVICWALLITLPFVLIPTLSMAGKNLAALPPLGWGALFYLILVSQLLGFFAWYKGMSIGGIARVSQVQLLQPFFTIAVSAVLLGEKLEPRTMIFALLIVFTVALGRRATVKPQTVRN